MKLLVIADPGSPELALIPRSIDATIGKTAAELATAAAEAAVILNSFGDGKVLRELFPLARNLRWVHSLAAGVEGQVFPEMVASPVPLTNSRGVYKESLGEFVIAAVLFFAKDLPRMLRNQQARRWEPFDLEMISRQTLGIVGYGEIGRAVARRAKALGMRVYASRRRPEPDDIADRVFARAELGGMLRESDYVVITAPLTSATRGLIGASEISAMKPGAVLINIGRGPVVDEPALIDALREKRIRGAALDVFDTEPLPDDHPFWTLDNVLLSPHTADHVAGWTEDAMRFFVSNLERFQSGLPLENVVDKEAGY
jgi:phosphoglycerate dehydrogenase-like enzyme